MMRYVWKARKRPTAIPTEIVITKPKLIWERDMHIGSARRLAKVPRLEHCQKGPIVMQMPYMHPDHIQKRKR